MNPATTKFQSFFSMWLVITASISLLALLFTACSAAPIATDPSKPTKAMIDGVNNSVAEVSHEVSVFILSSTRSVPMASSQYKGKQSL